MNTFTLKMYVSISYTELTRRNTVFIFLWQHSRNTLIPIQHVGPIQDSAGTTLGFYTILHFQYCMVYAIRKGGSYIAQ